MSEPSGLIDSPNHLAMIEARLVDGLVDGVDRVELLASWERPRSSTVFYRVRALPADRELVVKLDLNEEPTPPGPLYDAMVELDDVIESAEIEGGHGLRPVAWADDPPTIVTPFIDGDDVVSIMRRRDDPAWHDHMTLWMSQAGTMLSAYHAATPRPATAEEIDEATDDARRVADRMRISPDIIARILVGIDPPRRTARSYGDFGPGNLLGAPDGELYLLDPPVQPPHALIHRDLGNFAFELRRQLAGHGFTRHPPMEERFPGLHEALLDGYSSRGDRLGKEDLALISLFEARRCAGMARKRFPSRPGDVWWFARSALSRRREALSSAASQP